MSLLTIEEVKTWLREDSEESQVNHLIEMIMHAAETYLKNATGQSFDSSNKLAKLYCMVLVADWYENRTLIASKPSDKVRFTLQSMIAQLEYCETGGT